MRARFILAVLLSNAAAVNAQCNASITSAAAGGRVPQARAALEKSMGGQWTDSSYHCMGTLLERELKWSDARDWYEKAVSANPRSAVHHAAYGTALLSSASTASMLEQMSLGKKALAELEMALGLDSTLVDVRAALAQVYTMAPAFMGGGADKADAQVSAITRQNEMRGQMTRGVVLAARRDSVGAEQAYVAAIAAAPDSVVARYRLASFYRARKEWAKAFAVYDSVRRRSPKDDLLPYGFGITAAASGQQSDRGERELKAWIARPSKDATYAQLAAAHYSLGILVERKGKLPEAKSEYATVLRFNPDHKEAKAALDRLK